MPLTLNPPISAHRIPGYLVSCLLPIFCYSTHIVGYDKRPLGSSASKQIMEGMSVDEVKAILGPPHQRNKNTDGET